MNAACRAMTAGVVLTLVACGGGPTPPDPVVVNPPTPAAPVAVALAPASDLADTAVTFRGEQSTGQLSSYRWNFGDGSAEQAGADKVQVTYTYGCRARVGTEAERTFTYTLTVTDTLNRTSSASKAILIRYVHNGTSRCAT